MSVHLKSDEREAADTLTQEVMAFVGTTDRNEVECPREKSYMTPCIARDGGTAVADDGDCVGCGQSPLALLKQHRDRHPKKEN